MTIFKDKMFNLHNLSATSSSSSIVYAAFCNVQWTLNGLILYITPR